MQSIVASIPILVLRKSQIPKKQKIILACFLCLSLVMTTFAITRVGKIQGSTNVDIVWELFWQYMEAGVAVLMCSLTVFRTVFNTKQTSNKKRQWEPSASWIQRMKWKKSSEKSVDTESDGLPSIPGGTLAGLRTFIRRNNRSTAATIFLETDIGLSQMGDAHLDTIDEEKHHYHGISVRKDYTVLSTKV